MALDAETLNQLLDTLERFVLNRLRPLEAEVAEADAIPDEVVEEMKELGLFGLTIPEEYGGAGLTNLESVVAEGRRGNEDPATAGTLSDHDRFAVFTPGQHFRR